MTSGGLQEKAFNDLARKFSDGRSDYLLEMRATETIISPEAALPYIKWTNTGGVWTIYGSMMALSLIVLLYERFHNFTVNLVRGKDRKRKQ